MNLNYIFVLVFQFLITIKLCFAQISIVPPTATPGIVWKPCDKYTIPSQTWLTFSNGQSIASKYCYYFSSYSSTYSWHEANDFCHRKNATLATIHDSNTNYMLSHRNSTQYDNYYFYFWIGLNSLSKRGVYKWQDNTPNEMFLFTNISSNGDPIPPNVLDQGRCVTIKSMPKVSYYATKYTGLWFKDNCLSNKRFICQKLINPPTVSTPAPPPVGNCPPDWFQYANQKCIKYIKGSNNFNDSRDICLKTNNAEMLSIHSEEEQNFITGYTGNKPEPYIGMRRSPTSYSWMWDDTKPTDFTNWGIYSTSYYTNRCAIVITNITQPGKWAQVNCNEKRSVICEKPLDPTITKPGLTYAQNKCKIPGFDNFHQFGNSCYSIVDSDQNKYMNFSAAEMNCQSMNGSHLVSIVGPYEEAFLRYYTKQYGKSDFYWTGLQSKLYGDTNVSQAFEWTDEWPVYYTMWDNYEPQFAGLPQEECVLFDRNNGTWRTTMCAETYAYVCKVTTNKLPKMNTDKSGVCPQLTNIKDNSLQWIDIDRRSRYCYWFSIDRKGVARTGVQSWVDASFHCRARNGTLISIHSKHDLLLMKTKFSKTGRYYNTWIGLSSDPKGDYRWEDGSGVQFTNWDPTQKIVTKTDLINDDSRRLCVEVKAADTMWKQIPCSGSDPNYYACEVKKIYHSTTQPTQNPITIKQKSSKSDGLSGGAKAGIAFGVIGGVVVLLVIGFFVFKKYRPNSPVIASFENRLYASKRGNNSHN